MANISEVTITDTGQNSNVEPIPSSSNLDNANSNQINRKRTKKRRDLNTTQNIPQNNNDQAPPLYSPPSSPVVNNSHNISNNNQVPLPISPPIPSVTPRTSTPRIIVRDPLTQSISLNRGQRLSSKCCCFISQTVSIRWFIVLIFFIGICCTIAGTALGAARYAGKEHFTLSLLMIGVGVVLLTVSAIAWKMTSSDSTNTSPTNCLQLLGLTTPQNNFPRWNRNTTQTNYFTPQNYSQIMDPPLLPPPPPPHPHNFFPFMNSNNLTQTQGLREPPPSYAASMQEYRLRLLLYERSNPTFLPFYHSNHPPPPYYLQQFHAASIAASQQQHRTRLIHHEIRNNNFNNPQNNNELPSRPPSYQSRSSNNIIDEILEESPTNSNQIQNCHSHSPSVSSSASSQHPPVTTTTTTVVTVLHSVQSDNPEESDLPTNNTKKEGTKDGNLVTIVQTGATSQVNCPSSSSVIVTVNNHHNNNTTLVCTSCFGNNVCFCNDNNVQILAHL